MRSVLHEASSKWVSGGQEGASKGGNPALSTATAGLATAGVATAGVAIVAGESAELAGESAAKLAGE